MRFIDSNVFIHAYIKPKRMLQRHERMIKESAKEIIQRVNDGEEVLTTVVHLGEMANLLENFMQHDAALRVIRGILLKENIEVIEVSPEDYLSALPIAEEYGVSLNDALAYIVMRERDMREIYSFDKDFDRFTDIVRISR